MEDSSMNSRNYTSKLALSSTADSFHVHDNEESGWTLYLEDFMAANDSPENSSFVSGRETAAVSSKKDIDYNHGVMGLSSCERFSSKKRKCKTSVDDELEDTASSPLHSPTLNDLDQLYMKSKETDRRSIYQGKGNASVQVGERFGMEFQRKDADYSQLRKKGLCLVPMSMFLNYLS